MADKTTTLKTKTNDNVYPKVIGESRKDAFADSSTITHHFYDQTHRVGFQIANETNIKIQNSLQKPKGLTKTELVGVGANGQENIEIGDNLTLANGKLSATGGGSGGGTQVCIIKINLTSLAGGTYTTNIPLPTDGTTPVFIDANNFEESISPITYSYNGGSDGSHDVSFMSSSPYGLIIYASFKSDGTFDVTNIISIATKYRHFITLTKSSDKIYFVYEDTESEPYTANTVGNLANHFKNDNINVLVTGVLGDSNETLATPMYITGISDKFKLYYVLNSDISGNIQSKVVDVNNRVYTISDIVTKVE